MKAFIFFVLVLGQVHLSGCVATPPAEDCARQLRAVIDMGSGSTKMNMAEMNLCSVQPRIENKLDRDDSFPVPLESAKNSTGQIPEEIRAQAITALRTLSQTAQTVAKERGFKTVGLSVVATHALRTAANRDTFLIELEAAGFAVKVLSQAEEANAGYQGVLNETLPEECSKDNILVWDTGGGSTQFTRADGTTPLTKNFSVGADTFRKDFLDLKMRTPKKDACPADPQSPNPLGKNFGQARARVPQIAKVTAAELKTAQACVVGIGGVHNKAVLSQIQKNWNKVAPCACGKQPNCLPTPDGYSKKELQCLAEHLATKTDCRPEIKGPYAATAVSNLAMILGFMDQLKIERVRALPLNMGDHYLSAAAGLSFKPVPAAE